MVFIDACSVKSILVILYPGITKKYHKDEALLYPTYSDTL